MIALSPARFGRPVASLSFPPAVPVVVLLAALTMGLGLLPQAGHAQSGVALSVHASSLGPSADLHIKASDALRVRLRGSYLPYTYTEEFEDDDVTAATDADLTLGGPEARLEWHPFKTAFHLSGGALLNITTVDAQVVPTEPYAYSDVKTFSPEKLGSLQATASYPPVAPYAGIGFGDAVNSRWSFLIEIGAYYTGAPDIEMEGTGLIKPTAQNAALLNDGLESFVVLPHLAFGVALQL